MRTYAQLKRRPHRDLSSKKESGSKGSPPEEKQKEYGALTVLLELVEREVGGVWVLFRCLLHSARLILCTFTGIRH